MTEEIVTRRLRPLNLTAHKEPEEGKAKIRFHGLLILGGEMEVEWNKETECGLTEARRDYAFNEAIEQLTLKELQDKYGTLILVSKAVEETVK